MQILDQNALRYLPLVFLALGQPDKRTSVQSVRYVVGVRQTLPGSDRAVRVEPNRVVSL